MQTRVMVYGALFAAAYATAVGGSHLARRAPAVSTRPPMSNGNFLGLRTAKYAVADLAKAKAWYSTVLGVAPYFDEPYYVGFNVGGFELGLVPDAGSAPKRAEAGVAYWGVPDADSAYARLLSLGATPQEPVVDVGGGVKIGAVHDPFGNVFGVVENPHFKLAAP